MTWNPDISLGDVLNFVAIIAAGVGLFFTYRQVKQGTITQRADFIKALVTEFYGDTSIYEAFYKVDRSLFSSDEIILNQRDDELEKSVDKLLAYLDMVARLVKLKSITHEDARVLEYEFARCFQSTEIQKYLEYLDRLFVKKKYNFRPHAYFREFAETIVSSPLAEKV